WPAAPSLREVGSADDLPALAQRLALRVRAAWRWPAPAGGDARVTTALLPPGAALRPWAEGLAAHRRGDEAGALARWTEATALAPLSPRSSPRTTSRARRRSWPSPARNRSGAMTTPPRSRS